MTKKRTRPVLEIDYRILSILITKERLNLKTSKTAMMMLAGLSYAMLKYYISQMIKAGILQEERTNGRIYIKITKSGFETHLQLKQLVNKLILTPKGRKIVD